MTLVLAQAIPQPAGGSGGGAKFGAAGGKSYIVETLVVIVFFGLALFLVCKSSRRA